MPEKVPACGLPNEIVNLGAHPGKDAGSEPIVLQHDRLNVMNPGCQIQGQRHQSTSS